MAFYILYSIEFAFPWIFYMLPCIAEMWIRRDRYSKKYMIVESIVTGLLLIGWIYAWENHYSSCHGLFVKYYVLLMQSTALFFFYMIFWVLYLLKEKLAFRIILLVIGVIRISLLIIYRSFIPLYVLLLLYAGCSLCRIVKGSSMGSRRDNV